jgi:hypothetical protein
MAISDIVCQSQCLIGRHLSQSNIAEEVVSVRKKKWVLCRYESVQSDSTNFSQYLEKASNKDLASTRGLCDLSLRLDVNADCLAKRMHRHCLDARITSPPSRCWKRENAVRWSMSSVVSAKFAPRPQRRVEWVCRPIASVLLRFPVRDDHKDVVRVMKPTRQATAAHPSLECTPAVSRGWCRRKHGCNCWRVDSLDCLAIPTMASARAQSTSLCRRCSRHVRDHGTMLLRFCTTAGAGPGG